MKIAVIMENMLRGVSGGRYYGWLLAHVLGDMGHDVMVYTDAVPSFYLDAFRDYKQPKIHKVNLKYLDLVGFDCYVGIPFGGCIVAHRIAKKLGAWCCNVILDPKPITDKMIPRKSTALYARVPLRDFMKSMKNCTVISNSNSAIPTLQEWFKNDDVMAVTATVNEKVAKSIKPMKRHNRVSTVSRWEAHKGIIDALHAVQRLPGPPEFHVITSFGDGPRIRDEGRKRRVNVITHAKVSERKKFEVLASSRVFIYGSWYEGQGIPVLEAKLMNTPGVAYDFPVMREMATGWPLAKYKSRTDLSDKAREVWDNPVPAPITHDLEMLKKELGAIF